MSVSAKLLSHQNGEKIEISAPPLREKHHRKAEIRETRDIRVRVGNFIFEIYFLLILIF